MSQPNNTKTEDPYFDAVLRPVYHTTTENSKVHVPKIHDNSIQPFPLDANPVKYFYIIDYLPDEDRDDE